MYLLLAVFAIVMFIVQTLSLKQCRLPEGRRYAALCTLNTFYTGLIAAAFALWWLFAGAPPFAPLTLALGSVYGFVFTLAMFSYAGAMNTGPLSYSAFYFSASLMIPVIASMLFWGETATPAKWAGIFLFLLSFYFVNVYGAGTNRKGGVQWIVFCLLAFLLNGLLPVAAKVHQTALQGREVPQFMFAGFAAACLCSLIGMAVFRSLKHKETGIAVMRQSAVFAVSLAVSTGLGNAAVTYLSGRMPGIYLFPLVNGSMVVMLTLLSAILFKEKLTSGGIAGIATGLCAIVAINL
ncbi:MULTISPECIES: hypothetical protein [unclassified Paenibacillus]|uniref:hypothetical protein n=1 Tax=unclassified Paenibacillus TaxID=185978 RepID=UPI001C1198E5|nr:MULTISPECIES: hypothetical protein [unclassified Paenibacillus]MBU5445116.1 hypothetical protein [Paenibacillus sp. MSJ-34]CAH0122750.1 hypothetical protein PAE9249_05341 [Paenibacillus sp. CECT 9249]